jgi:ATP-dependent Clp endopeptidase proteolytic subunit ClpP
MTMSENWFEIRAQADDEAEIWIYDEIGDGGFFSESVSAKDLVNELKDIKAAKIALHINSPGGSVFDGQAIYNALRRHPASVTSYIDGLAASIAGVVAEAADPGQVVMAENALFMVHEAHALMFGQFQSGDLRKMANRLDKVGETIAGVYSAKTGKALDEIKTIMAEETWYTADEAKEAGFVDSVGDSVDLAACADFDLSRYQNVPPTLKKVPEPQDAATPFVDLPINEDRERVFDNGAARQAIEKWASSDGSGDIAKIDWPKFRKGFFWYDAANAEQIGSYKLIFADVVDGNLQGIVRAIHAAAAVMQGARGGVNIPNADRAGVKAHIKRYYEKLDETVPWEQKAETMLCPECRAEMEPVLDEIPDEAGLVTGYRCRLCEERIGDDHFVWGAMYVHGWNDGLQVADAGRVLSQKNYDKLIAARDRLVDVIAGADAGQSSSDADGSDNADNAGVPGGSPGASGDRDPTIERRLAELLARRDAKPPKE